MARYLVCSLLLLAGCTSAPEMDEWSFPEDEPRYQIVVESIELSPTKPGGEKWDAGDGRPDPCVLVGFNYAYEMTEIAYDEYSADYDYVTYYDYSREELGSIAVMINDEDPPGENDQEDPEPTPEPTPDPDPTPTPEPEPTPSDNYIDCDKIEGGQIGVEGGTLQVRTTVVTFHSWVLKAGESDEYHGFSWDQTGVVDVRVKAGNQSYIASGGSWMHPNASTASASAISHVEVCVDTDDNLDEWLTSLQPNDRDGETFVIDRGPGKGVERLILSVQPSEWSTY